MNCKWAEGYLSACLDGTLDPDVRDEVVAHIEGCTHCSSILEEYRHFDGLVGQLPRYEPPAELRARIFDSPEFAAILRALESGEEDAVAARHPTPVRPFLLSRPNRRDGHDRSLTPLPIANAAPQTPTTGDAGASTAQPADDAPGTPHPRRAITAIGAVPVPLRVGLVAAAVLLVGVGVALAFQRGLSHGTANRSPISNVGGFQGTPLTAGPRAVYERGGGLWSLPEYGNGVAQRLTPSGVVVGAGWAVAPVRGSAGGNLVAYIDLKTGMLHIVRSDDQKDHAIGQALVPTSEHNATFWAGAEGQAILGSLVWSPDGTQLAYLADPQGIGQMSLVLIHADGTGAATVAVAVGGSSGRAIWSSDGKLIAFVQTTGASQTVWTYDVSVQLAAPAGMAGDVAGAGASVLALGWVPAAPTPTITWASGDASSGAISGVWSAPAQQTGAAQRLTPAGQTFSAAAYAPNASGGTWLLGDGTAIYALAAQSASLTQLASVAGGVSAVAWSPDGSVAALVSTSGALSVWSPAGAVSAVATGVAAQPAPAWSSGGSALAFTVGGQLDIVRLNAGTVGVPLAVAGLSNPSALIWAPDGRQLAVSTPAGVALVSVDGTSMRLLDSQPAANQVAWSVAG